MPRPATDSYWRERVRAITENERLGPGPIRRRFEEEAESGGRRDWPSERTIGRIQNELRQRPEEERRPYREVHWPESFERGDLPWEASVAALELMQVWEGGPRTDILMSPETRRHLSPAARPSVRLARWFWRITQAASDAPALERRHIAGWLAAAEAVGSDVRRAAEGWLRYAPWRSGEARAAYEGALEQGGLPRFQLTASEEAQTEALLELFGGREES